MQRETLPQRPNSTRRRRCHTVSELTLRRWRGSRLSGAIYKGCGLSGDLCRASHSSGFAPAIVAYRTGMVDAPSPRHWDFFVWNDSDVRAAVSLFRRHLLSEKCNSAVGDWGCVARSAPQLRSARPSVASFVGIERGEEPAADPAFRTASSQDGTKRRLEV